MNVGGVSDYDYGSFLQIRRNPAVPATQQEQTARGTEQTARGTEQTARGTEQTARSTEQTAQRTAGVHEPSVTETSGGRKVSAGERSSARRDARLEDISLTFNVQEEFGYLGRDSDVRSLDVERAISDMKKDQVLQQYQYFVGSSRNLLTESADGTVFMKF